MSLVAESDSVSDESLTLDVSTSAQAGTLATGISKNAFPAVTSINSSTDEYDRTWCVEVRFADTAALQAYVLTFGNSSGKAVGDALDSQVESTFTFSAEGSENYTVTQTEILQLYLRDGVPFKQLSMMEIPNNRALPTTATPASESLKTDTLKSLNSGQPTQLIDETEAFTGDGKYEVVVGGMVECVSSLATEEEIHIILKVGATEYPIASYVVNGSGQQRRFSGGAIIPVLTDDKIELFAECSKPLDLLLTYNFWYTAFGQPLQLG